MVDLVIPIGKSRVTFIYLMSGRSTRRDTLRWLSSVSAIGLAGCINNRVPSNAGTASSPTSGPDIELSFNASVIESFAENHPGRVEISFSNEDSRPIAIGIFHGVEGPMSSIEGTHIDGKSKLVIFGDPPDTGHETPPGAPCDADEYAIPNQRTEGCWQPACDYAKLRSHYAIALSAGESLTWPYVVLDGFNETCLPKGTYEFKESPPVAIVQSSELSGTTPANGWTTRITKRLLLTIDDDGILSAEAELHLGSKDSRKSQSPASTPFEKTTQN